MKKFFKMGVFLFVFVALFASGCTDDTTNNITEQKVGIIAYESIDELPECNSTTIGGMALLESTGKIVYCADGEWVSLNGKDGVDGVNGKKGEKGYKGEVGTSCSMSALKDKSGYKVVCAGDSVGVILHGDKGDTGATGAKGDKGDTGATGAKGDKGDQGETGAKGEPGESCTVQPVKLDAESDSTKGYNILCGGKNLGYIVNGIDGIGCTLSDDQSGQVFVTCGNEEPTAIFKAMCGKYYYDPEYAQCNDGELEEICDGKILTLGKFCYNKKEYDLCKVFSGSDPIPTKYNPEKEGCVTDFFNQSFVVSTCAFQKDFDYELADLALMEDEIDFQQFEQYDLTANFVTKIYDVTVYFCHDEEIIPLCGNKSYDPTTQYCKESKVTNKLKCGNTYYTKDKKFCHEGELYDYCELDDWNPSTHFCTDGEIVAKEKCGESNYNPKKQFCFKGTPYERCGENDEEYNPTLKFCENDMLYNLCGGYRYNNAKQFCDKNKIFNKCNGQTYSLATQKCQLGNIVDKTGDYVYGSLLDTRDGQVYLTVEIGTQTWMAENLNYRKVFSATDSNSFCYKGIIDGSYCDLYGRLYTWAGAIDSTKETDPGYGKQIEVTNKQGICPTGWHIPSIDEWETLYNYIAQDNGYNYFYDNGANLAKFLKDDGIHSSWGVNEDPDYTPHDLYGFSAYAAGVSEFGNCSLIQYLDEESEQFNFYVSQGMCDLNNNTTDKEYRFERTKAQEVRYWSSSQIVANENIYAITFTLSYEISYIPNGSRLNKNYGAYVRCIMD